MAVPSIYALRRLGPHSARGALLPTSRALVSLRCSSRLTNFNSFDWSGMASRGRPIPRGRVSLGCRRSRPRPSRQPVPDTASGIAGAAPTTPRVLASQAFTRWVSWRHFASKLLAPRPAHLHRARGVGESLLAQLGSWVRTVTEAQE